VSGAASPDGFLRPATPADAPEIAAVHVATWQHAYAGLLSGDFLAALDVDQWAERWRNRLVTLAEGSFVYVLEQARHVKGFVLGGPSRGDDAGGEVYAIYVDPGGQGQGAGTRLLGAAARRLAEASFTEASLWVLADNHPSRKFYESRGWRADGTEQPWTYGPGQTALEVRYTTPLESLGA